MARIARLWDAASQQDSPLAELIRNLQQAVIVENPDYKAIEKCAQEISDLLHTEGDPLPLAEQELGVREAQPEPPSLVHPAQFTHQAEFGVEDDTSPGEARLERIKRWRQVALRGAARQRFRSNVTGAYAFCCMFTGQRLPKTPVTESAGVDAAHILPWSTHNINSLANGLCLNKLCHWALDAGVLKLSFDGSCSEYVVEVPERVKPAAGQFRSRILRAH